MPNRKYTNDAFEILNEVLASDSEDDLALIQQLQEESNSDDEFPEDQLANAPESEDSLADDISDGSAMMTPVEEYEDAHSHASSDPGGLPTAPRKAKRNGGRAYRDPNRHSRGMQEVSIKTDTHRSSVKLFAGEGLEDILHIAKSRDQWATDPTLPRRTSLCHLFSHTDEKRQMEATVGWYWYYDQGGREEFARKQKTTELSEHEAIEYIPGARGTRYTFLMGPYWGQKPFVLAPLQAIILENASNGWILNMGSGTKCLDWAPNCDGNTQYLALTTGPPRSNPAYTISSPTPSSIQIWAFSGDSPEICAMFCSEWGGVMQLKWCHIPRTMRKPGEHAQELFVGLLAGIWQDGYARVIDVQIGQKPGMQPIKLDTACFAARISGTLATCLTWLSATDLAIGHSNGQLAIYNIYENDTSRAPSFHNPASPGVSNRENAADTAPLEHTPWLSMDLHPSYVLDLTSAYPTHPALLISTSASGHLRLTSLRAPMTDFVLSNRTRSPPSAVAYHDGLLSVVGMEENSETLRVWGLRCFYTSVGVGTLAPGPGTGVIDVGKCHATIAAGGSDGSVIVTNPMRRVLGRREPGYQQCIFKHEWVRRPNTQTDKNGEGERQGMSRITEGYKAEVVQVAPKRKTKPIRETIVTTTIYEEETAVTALAWNPNVSCGGWLAVGWGSGLVRIQDVAI